MRNQLKKRDGERDTFSGIFVRYGTKSGWRGSIEKTLLLSDIKDKNGCIVTNHLWFNLTKEFDFLDMKPGDCVQFDARVKEYVKGYRGYNEMASLENPIEIDYQLSYPTKAKIVVRVETDKS